MNDENIHIGAMLKQCLSHWKIYIPICIGCLIAAIIFLLVTPKQYEFTARMQLVKNEQGMMSELKMLKSTGVGAMLGGNSGGVSVEDKIVVMMSRTNMTQAIRQTGYQIETRQRQGLKNVLLYGKDNPVKFIFPQQMLDTLSQSIKIKLTIEGGAIKEGKVKSDLFKTIDVKHKPLPCTLTLPVGSIVIALNDTAINPDKRTLTTRINPLQSTYEDLHDELNISAQETISDIVRLLIDGENKQRTYDLLNSIMSVYNQYSRGVKMKEADLNARFVKERLDTIATELTHLEHQIEVYKTHNSIPEPTIYTQIAIQGNQELDQAIMQTETTLKMMDYMLNYMNIPDNEFSAIPIVEGVGDDAIQLYNRLALERHRLATSSRKDNPALIMTENQLKEQRKMLIEAISATKQSVSVRLKEMKKKSNLFSSQMNAIPAQEREYIEMKRKQKMKETIYLFLMQKLQEKELANSPDEQAGRVIDAAYCSAKPVFPRKVFVLVIAMAAAFILSLMAISFKVMVLSTPRNVPSTPRPVSSETE